MLRSLLAVFLASGLMTPAAQAPVGPDLPTVRVAAASDLKFALDEAAARLRKDQPSIVVQPTYGSSGNIHSQLRQRAPFDLFLSADVDYPRDLVSRDIGTQHDLFIYAIGRIVLWVPNSSRLPIERDGLGTLEMAERIAIANPLHAPYGKAAEAAMRKAGVWERASRALVLGENVTQAAQFVHSGAADIGIIAKSLAVAPSMRDAGRFWEIPASYYTPLIQGGLILPWATNRAAAERVRDYLLSDSGRALLAARGFDVPAR